MAKFYGTLIGARNTAVTKTGTATTGIKAAVQSWNGSLISRLDENENGETIVRLEIAEGSSTYGNTIFVGTLKDLEAKLKA